MGDFHDRLVQARRDGTAPPQIYEDVNPAPEPEIGAVGFIEIGPGVSECQLCFVPIPASRTPNHADWHRRLGA